MLLFFESGESSLRFQGWEQEEWISQEYATVQHDSGIIIILSHWLCLGRVCVCVCSYNGVTLCFRLVEPIEVKMLNPSLKWMKLEEATRFWLNIFKNYFVLICFFFYLHVTFWTLVCRRKKTRIKESTSYYFHWLTQIWGFA